MTTLGFNGPELLIYDYYDALINKVDIVVEEQLEQFENDEAQNEENLTQRALNIKIRDFLNDTRDLVIEEIKQSRNANLEYYRDNKQLFTIDRNHIDENKIEALRAALFEKRYCFLVLEECSFAGQTLIKPRPYVVNFYFNPKKIVLI